MTVQSSLPADGQVSATVSAPPRSDTPLVLPDVATLQARLDWLEARVSAQAAPQPPQSALGRSGIFQAILSRWCGSLEANRTVAINKPHLAHRSRSPVGRSSPPTGPRPDEASLHCGPDANLSSCPLFFAGIQSQCLLSVGLQSLQPIRQSFSRSI